MARVNAGTHGSIAVTRDAPKSSMSIPSFTPTASTRRPDSRSPFMSQMSRNTERQPDHSLSMRCVSQYCWFPYFSAQASRNASAQGNPTAILALTKLRRVPLCQPCGILHISTITCTSETSCWNRLAPYQAPRYIMSIIKWIAKFRCIAVSNT